tara:strand:- start:15468 stop:15944 length:477 start_codon:yes stop_codon:yes gene_type:complete
MAYKNILFVGDGGVGKSTIIRRLNGSKNFNPLYESTYKITKYHMGDINNSTMTRLYDFPGQELHGKHQISDKIHLCVIVYDTTSKLSYKNIPEWKTKVVNMCGNVNFLIVGNKIDHTDTKNIGKNVIHISAKRDWNIDVLRKKLYSETSNTQCVCCLY